MLIHSASYEISNRLKAKPKEQNGQQETGKKIVKDSHTCARLTYDYIKEGGGVEKFIMKHNNSNCRTGKSDNKRIPSLKYQIYIVKISNLYVHEYEQIYIVTPYSNALLKI
jgi:hypothetical protein